MDSKSDFCKHFESLQCPKTYLNNQAAEKLQSGVLGLLWDDLAKVIKPKQEVELIRKNILLYKLKHEPKDQSIQTINKIKHLKEEQSKLNMKIKNLEDEWRKQEFVCRKKVQLLKQKEQERNLLESRRNILKLKEEQTIAEIKNCNQLRDICNHFMPPKNEDVSASIIVNCLKLVSNYSGGPEKRNIWNQVSESLGSIKVPILWNAILTARTQCTDDLIQLDLEESETGCNKIKSQFDLALAKVCSEINNNLANCVIQTKRTNNYQEATMEQIQKIEEILNVESSELNELIINHWLPLLLEVKKFEFSHNELQKEIEKIEWQFPDNANEDSLLQITCEIKNQDEKIADYTKEIQESFGILKSSEYLISSSKESLSNELEKINSMLEIEDDSWLHKDSSTELITFNNYVKMEALRKIVLKGEFGSYKHLQNCFSKSNIVVQIPIGIQSNISPNFPLIRLPLYYLIDFYKALVINSKLNRLLYEDNLNNEEENSPLNSPITMIPNVAALPLQISDQSATNNTLQILGGINSILKRTDKEIEEFENILKIWSNSAMQETAQKILKDVNVDGGSLEEWQNKFARLAYTLQKLNVNINY